MKQRRLRFFVPGTQCVPGLFYAIMQQSPSTELCGAGSVFTPLLVAFLYAARFRQAVTGGEAAQFALCFVVVHLAVGGGQQARTVRAVLWKTAVADGDAQTQIAEARVEQAGVITRHALFQTLAHEFGFLFASPMQHNQKLVAAIAGHNVRLADAGLEKAG